MHNPQVLSITLPGVRVFVFLSSICFVVWAFWLLFFLLFGRWRVLCFAVWAGERALPKQQKNKHAPAPSERVFFVAVGAVCVCVCVCVCVGVCVCVCLFLLFGRRMLFFCCCLGGGGLIFFCCLGGGRVLFFAVWVGGVIFFLLFGRGTGVHSLTGLPGSSLSDPTTKKTKQQKKKNGFPLPGP